MATLTATMNGVQTPAKAPAPEAVRRGPVNFRMNRGELITFTNQLSVMLASGVVLTDAMDAIAEKSRIGGSKEIIEDLSHRIKGGDSFSTALSNYPHTFNSMFISMVKASEASGRMPEMLEVLGGYLNAEAETRKQVKGAMIYPFIMVLMAIAATGTLMFFVLPRFTVIYQSRGAALPKLTQYLVNFSQMLASERDMTIIITTLATLYVLVSFWAKTPGGRRTIDYVKIHAPILGTMFIDTTMTRSMRIMATMLNTGVSLLDAVAVIQESCDNCHFQELWAQTDDRIRTGYQLSEAITISKHGKLVDPGVIQMLRAGEKGGRLGAVCDKISVFYEKKLANSIRNVTTMIEPVMIIVMGSIIGTIAIALLLPVFRISSVIAH
jgi:type IV pilus assembly protein PilC